MRHHVAQRKLGVKSAHRQAMLANMASSLVLHDRIETTLPRAKELRCIADRIVTLSKRGTVHAARRARIMLRNRAAVQKAFTEFGERFADRHGGYTRILKLGYRHGDSAPMAVIEYLPSARQLEKAAKEREARLAKKEGKKRVSLKEKVLGKAKAKEKVEAEVKVKGEEKKPKKQKTAKKEKKKEE